MGMIRGQPPAASMRRTRRATAVPGPRRPSKLVNVRVTARGVRPKPALPQANPAVSPDPRAALVGDERMRAGGQWHITPVYERAMLRPGHVLSGPALVVQEDATTVLSPGWRARIDTWANLVCET